MDRVVLLISIKHGVANNVMLQLYLRSLIKLLISVEMYVVSGSAPPPSEKFWVRAVFSPWSTVRNV